MVPKRLDENIKWRETLRDAASASVDMRQHLLAASAESCIFWINAFGWTYRLRKFDDRGNTVLTAGDEAHHPMLTWPVQDEIILGLERCIDEQQDANCPKSRDMGLTWLALFIFTHRFCFHPELNFGVVSRKEMLVDSRGDMDCLFEKVRYILEMLPPWMRPTCRTRYMHLHNTELNSTIAGESTNADVGRGGRKTAYLVDEAAAIPNGQDVEFSLSQTTGCQIWVSTHKGPGTQFYKRIKEGRGVIHEAPWYRHPEKAQNAQQYRDELGRIKWTSPWYEQQCQRMSQKAIAQEVDMNPGRAGDVFFDFDELARHRLDHKKPPLFAGDVIPADSMTPAQLRETCQYMDHSKFIFMKGHGRTPWKFWIELEDGRPPQEWSYVFGIDISNGTGASNSVLSVMAVETGKIVAKWWDSWTSPEEFAKKTAMFGVWFGGKRPPPFVCWEANGPGSIFGRAFTKLGYPFFYRQRNTGTMRNQRGDKWGWHSNKERKEVLLGEYRDAIASDRVIVHCAESLDECEDYIYNDSGVLMPAKLREEQEGGRALHGDHVIADALTVLAREEMGKQKATPVRAAPQSFAGRRDMSRQSPASSVWRI